MRRGYIPAKRTQSFAVLLKTMLSSVVLVLLFQSTSAINYYSYRQPNRSPPKWKNLLSIDQLALRGGYHATNYEVITEDGYSLWLHRIGNNSGPPVLMQHGILVTAEQWITRPKRDLAFLLLKEGYDVWLSNLRGNPFNEYSLNYSKSDRRFWDFSLQEHGMYDLPAHIDTILGIRKLDRLLYIGHSQGTTVFFVMCSTKPEYNEKILGAILLSPIAYTPAASEQAFAIRMSTTAAPLLSGIFRKLGIYWLGVRTELTVTFVREICANNKNTRVLCLDLLGLAIGDDRSNLNLDEWDFFIPYYGAATSVYVPLHFSQIYRTGEFKAFDLGPAANFKRYGTVKPPSYNLKLVSAPVVLIWSYNDNLLSESSVKRMASDLPNVLQVKAVPDPKFNHVDMYIGNNAPYILYPDLIQIMNNIVRNKGSLDSGKKLEGDFDKKNNQQPYTKSKMPNKEEEELLHLDERSSQLYSK